MTQVKDHKMLQSVLISGPKIPIYPEIESFYSRPGRLIIGKSDSGISFGMIRKGLLSKINTDTQITIAMHGQIMYTGGFAIPSFGVEYEHAMDMGSAARRTVEILLLIQDLYDGPLQITLDSCFSSNADYAIKALHPGSVLITNSKIDKTSGGQIFNIKYGEPASVSNAESNPYVRFLNLMHINAIQYSKFVIHDTMFTLQPRYELLLDAKSAKIFLDSRANAFVSFSDSRVWNGKKVSLVAKQFSSEEVYLFSNSFFQYSVATQDKDFTAFLGEHLQTNEYLSSFVNKTIGTGLTHLSVASQRDDSKLVDLLLKYGADVNYTGIEGYTPLHDASEYCRYDNAKLLIEHNADVNYVNKKGVGALFYASQNGCERVVSLLLDQDGIIIDQPTEDNVTALGMALQQRHFGIVKLLVQRGARVDIPNKNGMTPISYAVEKAYNRTVVLEKGYDEEVVALEEGYDEMVALFKEVLDKKMSAAKSEEYRGVEQPDTNDLPGHNVDSNVDNSDI